MKKLFTTLLFLLSIITGYGQTIAGNWYGALNVSGSQLHIVFHIAKNGDVWSSTMDSPDQGAFGLATDKTQVDGNQLSIEVSKFGLKYTATYQADSNKITGTFAQGGGSFPLVLTTIPPTEKKVAPVKRPQDPTSFSYRQEEVTFSNKKAGNTLAGTLTMPSGTKPSKVVILISGSGPQNRNEEVAQFNHRPFLVWSDWLTRNGIAVLRYDDRGIGQSTGDFSKATSADFADDAESAVSYLQSRPDMKGISIGLMGHSEGGMIAPMVAARNKAIQFAVLLAAPGIPITELMIQQSKDQMRLSGAPKNVIAQSSATNAKLFAAMNRYQDIALPAFKLKMDSVMYAQLSTMPKEALGGQSIEDVVQRTARQMYAPWFRYFIAYQPAINLQKLTCPVLALNGTLDMQVQGSTNLAGIKIALQKGGNKRYEVVPLTGLNHLFQQATTGAVTEYAQISETVSPLAMNKVTRWIKQLK
ncbi:alpha/beta hydrolase family protein [Mucilaginibacter lacusdianchii]|uniref:alpha/beta hydrolase family protein n=1 Tax=Mucilaginibacter lacusdianchii TaxID=2684211 RepID=UPI00131BD6F1|nr:alpha/beta fold hydrolase [Mucilaginibacter sp. JXJ CY 39]